MIFDITDIDVALSLKRDTNGKATHLVITMSYQGELSCASGIPLADLKEALEST